jgi:hypothetical protein
MAGHFVYLSSMGRIVDKRRLDAAAARVRAHDASLRRAGAAAEQGVAAALVDLADVLALGRPPPGTAALPAGCGAHGALGGRAAYVAGPLRARVLVGTMLGRRAPRCLHAVHVLPDGVEVTAPRHQVPGSCASRALLAALDLLQAEPCRRAGLRRELLRLLSPLVETLGALEPLSRALARGFAPLDQGPRFLLDPGFRATRDLPCMRLIGGLGNWLVDVSPRVRDGLRASVGPPVRRVLGDLARLGPPGPPPRPRRR